MRKSELDQANPVRWSRASAGLRVKLRQVVTYCYILSIILINLVIN